MAYDELAREAPRPSRPSLTWPTFLSGLRARVPRDWKAWLLGGAIPALALLELAAHVVQVSGCSSVRAADWDAARAFVAAQAHPDDLIAFAPRWVDPVGREHFGDSLMTLDREARADETRFTRAFEVSVRGGHVPELATWRRASRERFGAISVTTLENPAPVHVLADLVAMLDPAHVTVSVIRNGHESSCAFGAGAPLSGGLGAGQPVSRERFTCEGGVVVAASLVTDLSYYPRRCIYAPTQGGAVVRLRFHDVPLGQALRGHHAVYIETETAHAPNPPVVITVRTDQGTIGEALHRDGESWKGFEFDTRSLAGTRADLIVDLHGQPTAYCFEAVTL